MFKSIRWRLQAWHAITLILVVAGFGVLLYLQIRRARLQEIDAELHAAARVLDGELRGFPPHILEGGLDDGFDPNRPPPPEGGPNRRPFGPPPRDRNGKGPPPRRPPPPDRPERRLALPMEFENRFGELGDRSAYFAVWTADGVLLKAAPAGVSPPSFQGLPDPEDVRDQYLARQRDSLREVVLIGPRRTRILVGRSIERDTAALARLAWQIALTGAGVLAVGLAGGWFLSRGVIRPIETMSQAASAISVANLTQRIDVREMVSELGGLARILNDAFGRLEAAFRQQSRFTADASHELRTPLSIIHTHLELALTKPRSAEEYREAIETCLRASQRMKTLVDGLLTLARADAGKLELELQKVDLGALAKESAALIGPLALQKEIRISVHAQHVFCRGDPARITRVLNNLLTNAINYNKPGGEVRLTVAESEAEGILTVSDTGCGIAEEDCQHIFERFYRVDQARTRESGGYGLGLAICQSIVDAHGGKISVSSTPDLGSTFEVRLPKNGSAG